MVEVLPERGIGDVEGLEIVGGENERRTIEIERNLAVVVEQDRGGRSGPDLGAGHSVTQLRPEQARDDDHRCRVARFVAGAIQAAEIRAALLVTGE
jgi:hypothetical protein